MVAFRLNFKFLYLTYQSTSIFWTRYSPTPLLFSVMLTLLPLASVLIRVLTLMTNNTTMAAIQMLTSHLMTRRLLPAP
jgi:hypothetical protein